MAERVNQNFREFVFEKVELAAIYLDDGAMRSSARCLREAADELDRNAVLCDRFIEALQAKGEVGHD